MGVTCWNVEIDPEARPLALARAIAAPSPAPNAAPAPIPAARPQLPSAEAVLPYLKRMDEARWYSNWGPLLSEFESRLAARHGLFAHVATAANATQALTMALLAMDLRPGSLCAMPAWTFVATAHAVHQAGLVPWFLDVDPDNWMLDPAATAEALRHPPGEVSAVIPVAAFGRMPDLDAWRAFRHVTGVPVLIDAAAAFDAAGKADLPLVVSLHATKVLGVGEGGYLATEDPELAIKVRQLSSFGFHGSREAQLPATNAKLSEYAAAVGLAALEAWPHDRLRWMRVGQHYRIALTDLPPVGFQDGWGVDWVTSVCVVRLPDGAANAVEAALDAAGVQTRRWWGRGCHAMPAFAVCPRTALPATERLAGSTIGLPMAIDLNAEELRRITEALSGALPAFA
jgi:dTDP-4-amino-4,6-dideoxygalactose transaminase